MAYLIKMIETAFIVETGEVSFLHCNNISHLISFVWDGSGE